MYGITSRNVGTLEVLSVKKISNDIYKPFQEIYMLEFVSII